MRYRSSAPRRRIDLGPPFVARHGMTSAEYQQAFDKNVADGFRLALVNGYRVGDQTLYAAIRDKKASPAWVARHGMTSGEYQTEIQLAGQPGLPPDRRQRILMVDVWTGRGCGRPKSGLQVWAHLGYSAASLWPRRALSLWISSSAASEITVPGGKMASAPALWSAS